MVHRVKTDRSGILKKAVNAKTPRGKDASQTEVNAETPRYAEKRREKGAGEGAKTNESGRMEMNRRDAMSTEKRNPLCEPLRTSAPLR